eukprot:TRINITY_DN26055_c0_g1_i1.p1 TRINITY_DN26055_c0_g1~~TRINITY_DN26055_c0_g1_i1.p1  ORF type:complete len:148 (+),score=20.55 TRINITY_DN26055_c0_g1_i1:41-445(+)
MLSLKMLQLVIVILLISQKETSYASTRMDREACGLTDKQKAQIRENFELYDSDGSGEIDTKELKIVMSKTSGPRITKREVQKKISDVDDDGSGTISYEEFLKYTVKPRRRSPKRIRIIEGKENCKNFIGRPLKI